MNSRCGRTALYVLGLLAICFVCAAMNGRVLQGIQTAIGVSPDVALLLCSVALIVIHLVTGGLASTLGASAIEVTCVSLGQSLVYWVPGAIRLFMKSASEIDWRPLGPIGVIVGAVAVATGPSMISLIGHAVISRLFIKARLSLGLCEQCAYNLRGNTSGKCPECGAIRVVELGTEESGKS